MRFERITIDPARMGGVPCIRGLRVPVATVVGMVAEGMTPEEILEAYPYLEARTFEKRSSTPPKLSESASFPSAAALEVPARRVRLPLVKQHSLRGVTCGFTLFRLLGGEDSNSHSGYDG